MNSDNILVNTQSSIRIAFDKVIYFDPYKIEENKHDADIIFITHDHYDHMDKESIARVKNESTIVVAPKSMEDVIRNISFKEYYFLNPFDEIKLDKINIKTIPAYNLNKPFHLRSNNWLGYIITYNENTYYIAGDTDKTAEAMNVKCDIAFVPIGGHFTMDAFEASELIKEIKPKVVIPTHYGSIVGSIKDGEIFKKYLIDTNIEVLEKI